MGTYDYIVVGAGSAGAVVAGRLSEDAGSRVLLLESGGSNKSMKVQVPAAFSQQFKTELDWEFYTEAEPHLGGRSIYHPRGRMLGGCSSMNAMIYMRGNATDFDGWAKDGATGWSYDEVLPFFKRSEANSRGADAYHGDSGPLPIQDLRSPNPLTARIIEGMVEQGMPRNDDFNGADQLGAGFNQVTQRRGRRVSTHEAFVRPARSRGNFTVVTGAHVTGLRMAGDRVVGVDVERDGRAEFHRAEREVVLSAGAFNTPQILMLSGIGPADHLREHGIDVVVDNPNVGAHLMDHPIYLVNYETTATGTLADAESPVQLAKFLARGRGLLTSNVPEASGFVHTRSGEAAPDIQILAGPAYFWNHGQTSHTRPAYVLAPSLVGSKSRGSVRLRSSDPRTHAAVTFNYFAEQADMDSMVAGIEICREIAATSALRDVTGRELTPGAHAATRQDLEAAIRREVEHTYHPSCTARIGSESEGVVDPELRVHGVAGLRVADTSVFPTITSGNTHAPAVLVGEKAADLIRTGELIAMTETTLDIQATAHEIVDRLQSGETAWARTSRAERRAMLARFGELVEENSAEWVELAVAMKGLAPDSPLVGEEWISGPWAVLAYVDALTKTLDRLEQDENPLDGFATRQVAGDRTAVQVLPHTTYDRLLLMGYSAQLWLRPGVSLDQARRQAGLGQRAPYETRGTCLVLGAGNITSIAPLDVLYVLFADNRVAVLKVNPIAAALKPLFERIFAPFIELGAVEVITGGVEIGSALAHHPDISAVHMTGSEATHDAIVWGKGAARVANKAAGTPVLDKPITSELGGVSPVIVVPGRWSHGDLRRQARHVATLRLHNSGSNCVAAQMVVLSSDWAQKDAFLAELRRALEEAPARPAWYPGSADRVASARADYPQAELIDGQAERTLITGIDLGNPDQPAVCEEYFGPVLTVAELPGDAPEFLDAAVTASNDHLRGTLGANVLVHPRSRKALGPRFDEAIARLRYGTIGINAWTAVGYLTPYATWGAFPGHALDDIQSGHGVVHNALLLADTERTVVTGPFRPLPKPPWFVDNRTAATTGRRLTSFAARPRWAALPGIFVSALRG